MQTQHNEKRTWGETNFLRVEKGNGRSLMDSANRLQPPFCSSKSITMLRGGALCTAETTNSSTDAGLVTQASTSGSQQTPSNYAAQIQTSLFFPFLFLLKCVFNFLAPSTSFISQLSFTSSYLRGYAIIDNIFVMSVHATHRSK